jgi:hypothetical protein
MATKSLTLHSEGPWELVEATEHHGPYVVNRGGGTVADLYAMSNPTFPSTRNGGISRPVPFSDADANAAFIVTACNAHEALRDSLYEMLEPYEGMESPDLFAKLPGTEAQRVTRARDALLAAGGVLP